MTKISAAEDVYCSKQPPGPFVGEDCVYFRDTTLCWVTMVVEYEDWGCLTLDIDGEGPPGDHWLEFETSVVGLDEVVGFTASFYGSDDDRCREAWMLDLGVAPGQRFRLVMMYGSWRDYWGEYDSEVCWDLIWVEPWTPQQCAEAWEAYFAWAGRPVARLNFYR